MSTLTLPFFGFVRTNARSETDPPDPPPRSGPVFIGDILTSRGSDPELLRRWRQDEKADPDS